MKSLFLIALVFVVNVGFSAPRPEFALQAKARATATDFFRAGNVAAAIAQLTATVRAEVTPNLRDVALLESVAEVAAECYNRRELALGRSVANEAFVRAAPLFANNNPATRSQRANLASTLGLLKDELFHDWAGAESYYAAALSLDEGNKTATARQQALRERQKAKNGPAGAK
jgi:hypothetical protein